MPRDPVITILKKILANQSKLDRVLANQKKILANQRRILAKT